MGAVTAVVCASFDRGGRLPPEVTVDPASLPAGERPVRLPQSLGQAVDALEGDEVLREAMGEVLFEAFVAVRRAEIERLAGQSDEDVVAATRWIP